MKKKMIFWRKRKKEKVAQAPSAANLKQIQEGKLTILPRKIRNLSNAKLMRLASYLSVATALFLIVFKFISYLQTHSLAILSSLMDSCLDLGASFVSLIAIYQALMPADKNHRFGHGKAEALGGLAQGLIISLSAVFLISETIHHILHPQQLERLDVGLGVMIISIGATFLLISFQRFVVRKTNSIAVHADRVHYTGDILMNVGVIVSMLLSYLFGFKWADSLFAGIVSIYLLYTASRVIISSISVLMDKELPASVRRKIKQIALADERVLAVRDLRTRNAGIHSFVQFNVELARNLTLEETHAICDEIEKKVKELIPESETLIHPEPQK